VLSGDSLIFICCLRFSFYKTNAAALQVVGLQYNKLIRRWDSERELFYDDILHVLQNTKRTYRV